MTTIHKDLSIHLEHAVSLAKVCAVALEKGQHNAEHGDINGTIELLFYKTDSACGSDLDLQNENSNGALRSRAS